MMLMEKLSQKALVSIVMPCYNPSCIRNSLNSIQCQTYTHWEVICVDDCSDIDVFSEISSFQDDRIKYYRLDKKSNANVARNYGITYSHGDYIAMLDADDEWLPTHLERSLELLHGASVDGVYGSLILRNKNSDNIFVTRNIGKNESVIDFLLSTGYGAQTSTLVMTSESVKNTMWNEKLNRHQDYDFVVRFCRKYRMVSDLEATVVYRISDSFHKIDFNSCISFIQTVEDEISPVVYMSYHRHMLYLALANKASDGVVCHYRKAATFYEYLLSLNDYLSLLNPQSRCIACFYKFKYLWIILFTSIK